MHKPVREHLTTIHAHVQNVRLHHIPESELSWYSAIAMLVAHSTNLFAQCAIVYTGFILALQSGTV